MAASMKMQVMDSMAVSRTITRLSHEIIERNDGADQLILVGILTRGEPIAKRIQYNIQNLTKVSVPIGSVDITFHRDDFVNVLWCLKSKEQAFMKILMIKL